MPFLEIPKEYSSIISEYAKILIPALISFLVTRFSLMHPKKRIIKENQFDQVYLPLYLMVKQYLEKPNYSKENLSIFIRKVDKLIYKNYQYFFPKTLKLFDILKAEAIKDSPSDYHISNFGYQVVNDYEQLKRELGYPTHSLIHSVRRLNRLDKVIFFAYLFALITGIISAINVYIFLMQKSYQEVFWNLITLCATAVVYYIVSQLKKI